MQKPTTEEPEELSIFKEEDFNWEANQHAKVEEYLEAKRHVLDKGDYWRDSLRTVVLYGLIIAHDHQDDRHLHEALLFKVHQQILEKL